MESRQDMRAFWKSILKSTTRIPDSTLEEFKKDVKNYKRRFKDWKNDAIN